MIDIVTHFSKIIDYLEQVTSYSSKLNDGLEEMIKEQRENVK